MTKTIRLNRNFLKFGMARRLWYTQVASQRGKLETHFKKRGIVDPRLPGFTTIDKCEIFNDIIMLPPQGAYEKLCERGIEVETVGFSEEDLFPCRSFPLLRSAHHSACRSWFKVDGFRDLTETFVDVAVNFDFVEHFCSSRKSEIVAKALLRAPFYIGGILFLDTFLLPQLIGSSDFFLSSKYFDFLEWSPLALDSTIGIGLWGLRSKSEAIKKAEPNKLPVPFLGYWLGRIAKKIVFTALAVVTVGLVFTPGVFVAISRYIKLRSFDWSKETSQEKADFLSKSLMRTELQRSLIERWIRKGKVEKAQKFYKGILNNCADPESGVHQGQVTALTKALNKDAHELLASPSKDKE